MKFIFSFKNNLIKYILLFIIFITFYIFLAKFINRFFYLIINFNKFKKL